MSARKMPAMNVDPTLIQKIAEGEKPPAQKIDANGANSPATGTAEKVSPQEPPAVNSPATAAESQDDFLWQFVEEKEPKIPMTIRVPASMKRDLLRIEKFSNMTMTDVLVEGALPVIERELAKIKARGAR